MMPTRAYVALALVLSPSAWGCGVAGPHGHGGIGSVGGGGGGEILDGGEDGTASGSSGSSSGSSGYGSGSSGSGASGASSGSAATGAGSTSTGQSSGSGTSTGQSSGSASTGESSSSGSSGAAAGLASGSGTSGSGDADAGEGGTGDGGDGGSGEGGSIVLDLGGPVHLVSLQWTISGPHMYEGDVNFGDAQSFEWVIGGIIAGDGYTLSVTATDAGGDPCHGTSSPFSVVAGVVSYATMTIVCTTPTVDPADVTTGSVAIEAGVTGVSD